MTPLRPSRFARAAMLLLLAGLVQACNSEPGPSGPGTQPDPDDDGDAPVTVGSVELSSPVQGLVAGDGTRLEVTVRDTDGNVIGGAEVTFSTSDDAVATVDGSGDVTGVAPGTAGITATADGESATVMLTVTIDWTPFAGHWEGEWRNTSFGSRGDITADVTIDVATLEARTVLDIDGTVFGMPDPAEMEVEGTLGANSISLDHQSMTHGRILFELMPDTEFELESESVPAGGIDAWDFEGRYSATSLTGDFTVHFDGGGTADGTIEVTKQ